jgi:hypothetical protein
VSAPQYYVHARSGARFRLLGVTSRSNTVVLQRIDQPIEDMSTDYWAIPAGLFAAAFTPAAFAPVDEPVPYTVPGIQPRVEFTSGPTVNGPLFSDEYLATMVARWSRQQAGGAS